MIRVAWSRVCYKRLITRVSEGFLVNKTLFLMLKIIRIFYMVTAWDQYQKRAAGGRRNFVSQGIQLP